MSLVPNFHSPALSIYNDILYNSGGELDGNQKQMHFSWIFSMPNTHCIAAKRFHPFSALREICGTFHIINAVPSHIYIYEPNMLGKLEPNTSSSQKKMNFWCIFSMTNTHCIYTMLIHPFLAIREIFGTLHAKTCMPYHIYTYEQFT